MKSQTESQPAASTSGVLLTPPSKPFLSAAQSAPPKQAKLVIPFLLSPRPRADTPAPSPFKRKREGLKAAEPPSKGAGPFHRGQAKDSLEVRGVSFPT